MTDEERRMTTVLCTACQDILQLDVLRRWGKFRKKMIRYHQLHAGLAYAVKSYPHIRVRNYSQVCLASTHMTARAADATFDTTSDYSCLQIILEDYTVGPGCKSGALSPKSSISSIMSTRLSSSLYRSILPQLRSLYVPIQVLVLAAFPECPLMTIQ